VVVEFVGVFFPFLWGLFPVAFFIFYIFYLRFTGAKMESRRISNFSSSRDCQVRSCTLQSTHPVKGGSCPEICAQRNVEDGVFLLSGQEQQVVYFVWLSVTVLVRSTYSLGVRGRNESKTNKINRATSPCRVCCRPLSLIAKVLPLFFVRW